MAKENIDRLKKHFEWLASGKFHEEDFRKEHSEGPLISMGKMSPERRQLIISDAKKHLQELELKFPSNKESKEENEKTKKSK